MVKQGCKVKGRIKNKAQRSCKKPSKAEDSVWWIHSKRRKTGTEFHAPLLELPLQIIEKYRKLNKNGKMFVMSSCSKTKGNLKKIQHTSYH